MREILGRIRILLKQLRKRPWPMSFDRCGYLVDQGRSVYSVQPHTRTASVTRAVISLINSHFLYLLSMWHFDPIIVAQGTLRAQEREEKKPAVKMYARGGR